MPPPDHRLRRNGTSLPADQGYWHRQGRSGMVCEKRRNALKPATTMFVRFREAGHRLQVSLAETRRLDGRVRQDHVASLGSIRIPPMPTDRLAYWTRLHERLATLANRIDQDAYGAILAAIHARIPMPTPDDQQAVRRENARAEAAVWDGLNDAYAAEIADTKALLASMTRTIADREAAAADVAGKAQAAAERLARAERGEDAGSIGKPMTPKDIAAAIGWKAADIRHAYRLIEIEEIGAHDALMADILKRRERAEKAAARAILRKRRSPPSR
jgi:hypothetical protein